MEAPRRHRQMASTEPPRQPRRHLRADYVARPLRHRAGVASMACRSRLICALLRAARRSAASLRRIFACFFASTACAWLLTCERRLASAYAMDSGSTPPPRRRRDALAELSSRHGTPSPRPLRHAVAATLDKDAVSRTRGENVQFAGALLCESSANWPLRFVCFAALACNVLS